MKNTRNLNIRPFLDRAAEPDPVVRPAHFADHPKVARLLFQAYRQYRWVMLPELHGMHISELMDLESRPSGSDLLVAEVDGRIVGTATYIPAGVPHPMPWPRDTAMVRDLGVDPEARRRGVGRSLMWACIDRALQAHLPAIGLHTADFMAAAGGLYESLGFSRVPALDVDIGKLAGIAHGPRLVATAYMMSLE